MTVAQHGSGAPAATAVHRAAREEGTAPALLALLGELGPGALAGAGGHAVLPAGAAPATAEVLRTYRLPGGDVLLVRDPAAGAPDRPAGAALALLRLRLGLAQGLRETCVAHLSGRPSGDSTILMHQLVKAQIAETFAHQLEIGALLETATAGAPPLHLHAEITATGRALLRLMGAHGFLAGGPGEVAHVSELLADIHQETGEPGE